MIFTALNRDVAILSDISATLSQLKDGAKANGPLVLNHDSNFDLAFNALDTTDFLTLSTDQFLVMPTNADGLTVQFYSDKAKENLVFTDTSAGDEGAFVHQAGRIFYSPPDSLINDADGLSTTLCLPLYWVTATYADSTVLNLTYKNASNLLFTQVIVASKEDAKFVGNDNYAILVPAERKTINVPDNDDRAYEIVSWELRIQMNVLNWTNLSEQVREAARNNAYNLIRLGLFQDRYRSGNSCLYDKNINGTYVSPIKPLPSPDVLRAKMTIQCAYLSTPSTY